MTTFLTYWPVFMKGAGVTLMLSMLALVLGLLIGLVVALLRLSRSPILSIPGLLYTEIFRSIPTLVVLFFAYFGLSFFMDIEVSPFEAATIALTLLASSLMSEVIRGGIESVPRGQWLAAYASGMSSVQVMRYVIAPQAMRVMMAPTVGVYVATLKESSMASIVGYVELMKGGLLVRDTTGDSLSPLLTVAVIYFVINYCISLVGLALEHRFRILT
jgi:His/Glu/Gln/Arg/opine family amino acid ABC transporter permease subunit